MGQIGIFEAPNKDKGYICGCCGLFVKRYRRKFNSNMALCLIYLYKSGIRDWVHVEKFLLERKLPRCGDFPKLVHYGLLEKKHELRDDESNRNGYYKITGQGLMFVEQKLTVRSTAVLFNNQFEWLEGKQINILDALGEKFRYDELMRNEN